MKYTIDIDNGGTFTDGFFTSAGRMEWVKVDTTPHDLTVCFLACIEEGAAKFGVPVAQLLRDTEVIRFSTTHATNTLIQRSGPRLGLIVTKGFEESLYSTGGRSAVLDTILSPAMVTSIDPPGPNGEPDSEQVRLAIRTLLGRGARMIVVSLSGSHTDPAAELKVREIADDDYPRHYLGAVPLLLSHEASTTTDEASRTNVALLNAYFHPDMVRFLYKAEDDVRGLGYRKPLLVTHADGGAARVAKTTAIMTHNSGPSAGIMGTSFMSRYYDLPYVASLDIGGTSADISLVINGVPGQKRETTMEGIPVKLPLIEVYPAAAGGGSIARPGKDGKKLQVGPDSAGAMPGPACYGLGGMYPTSTDACVVLGYIDPNYFLGGKRTLDADLAREAINENLSAPLGFSDEECARMIISEMEDICAEDISNLIQHGNYDPSQFVLFSFGGGGGTFAAGIAEKAGIPKVYCFRFSSVFSAFGSSCADILHTYESLARLSLTRSGEAAQAGPFNAVVQELRQDLLRDMRGEGFPPEAVTFSLELEAEDGTIFDAPVIALEGANDFGKILDAYAAKGGTSSDALKLRLFRLRASSPAAHPEFTASPAGGASPDKALMGKRGVYWKDRFMETPVYAQMKLENGNVITGPAIIESDDTTIVVPGGKKYTVDQMLNGIIESA
jgi:N-methylhydantoinase A